MDSRLSHQQLHLLSAETVSPLCFNQSVHPRRILIALCLAELLAMTMWFTGATALPQLARLWHISIAQAAPLTTAVQFGFVAGALLIAFTNLADIFNASHLFAISSLFAAAANAAFAYVAADHRAIAIALRFLTGAALAGVYPVGMKLIASWFREGRGFALGALVAALTFGSASSHLIAGLQTISAHELPWRAVTLTSSALAVLAAVIVFAFVNVGPYHAPVEFRLSAFTEFLRNRQLLLANLGYLGHMWELYSMWAWIAIIFAASRARAGLPANPVIRELSAFIAIAAGAIGCLWAGSLADRFAAAAAPRVRIHSRARVAIIAMIVSACCCIAAALAFQHYALLTIISFIWGISVVADSAQFSAIITEVADQRYVGTALTLQTAAGFLLTTASIKFAALFAAAHGWPAAMMMLALGPVFGTLAMLPLLRQHNLP